MELLGKLSLYLHIATGTITLLSGPIAIFYNFKNPRNHRIAGKVFYYAMLCVAATAIAGYFKHPDVPFYQLLLGISLLVLCGIFRGVRSIFLMKGRPVNTFDWVYTGVLAFNGLWMLERSIWHFNAGTMMAIPILMVVFGLGSLSDARENWKVFSKPGLMEGVDWMGLHARTMLGAFTASTTAFTVNAAHFLPWWAQWFGPTLLIVPLQIYFGRKFKAMKAKKVALA